jgi:transposase
MMTERVSPAELDYIAWALGQGPPRGTLSAIAGHLERSRFAITLEVAKMGLAWPRTGRPAKLSGDDMTRLRELVPSVGITRSALLLDVSPSTVSNWAKRFGVKSPWKWNGHA